MAWTAPRTWVSGAILTAAQLNEQVRDNELELAPFFAAWTSFTPTFSGTWANGNATTVGKYLKVGRFVAFYAQIVIGSTTTKGAGTMTVSLPVATSASWPLTGNQASNFQVMLLDSGTKAYPGLAECSSTTSLLCYSIDASATYASFGGCSSTAPFTWGTGDSVAYSGFYESAS